MKEGFKEKPLKFQNLASQQKLQKNPKARIVPHTLLLSIVLKGTC